MEGQASPTVSKRLSCISDRRSERDDGRDTWKIDDGAVKWLEGFVKWGRSCYLKIK